ncbi:MAG: hypothetical protein Q8P32_00920 [Candidatus Komeilibacteria bacterium]|nr:hypothetical protein [Candidatus Komeilibacteria bacterium]
MKLYFRNHNRHSIRLPEHDYSQSGIYFVTICCYEKQHFFGEINDGRMLLSPIGQIAKQCWLDISQHFRNVILDEYVIMPNHVHGLIEIVNHNHNVGAQNFAPLRGSQNKFQVMPRSLGSIIRGYKIGVTKWCRQNNMEYFKWQRNYYERIIRDEMELFRVRKYIKNNPVNWQTDKNNIKI